MTDAEVTLWCQQNNWTEPRRLETDLWVAFPPGGVIETPIPKQIRKHKIKPLRDIADIFLLAIAALILLVISIVMSPFFIQPAINSYQKNRHE